MLNPWKAWEILAGAFGGVSVSEAISWPDAGNDKCLECGVVRREHDGKDHRFKEEA